MGRQPTATCSDGPFARTTPGVPGGAHTGGPCGPPAPRYFRPISWQAASYFGVQMSSTV